MQANLILIDDIYMMDPEVPEPEMTLWKLIEADLFVQSVLHCCPSGSV